MNTVISKPPIPENESARIEALRQYRLLDTPAERSYDELTELASLICRCPIAQLSLVDENRQWFKSKIGLSVQETERDIAFCAHTILESDLMIVKDASQDERFQDNPLVRADPNIRFYAGVPLINPHGFALGSFCVIDRQPRELNSEQLFALRALARQTMILMELRRVSNGLAEALQNIKTLQGMLPICSQCKKIRDDQGAWQRLEQYISTHSEAEFTHGICPNCIEKLYPEFLKAK